MYFSSVSTVVRASARFVPILAVRLALGATLSSPQPIVALRAIVDVLAAPFAHAVLRADQAVGSSPVQTDPQAQDGGPSGALPGPGWG